jgi:hypothetical protein
MDGVMERAAGPEDSADAADAPEDPIERALSSAERQVDPVPAGVVRAAKQAFRERGSHEQHRTIGDAADKS